MEFYDVIEQRRSIRQFRQQAVEQAKIDRILEAALRAPSARNTHSSEVMVVTDTTILAKLAVAKPLGGALLENAPLGIIVCGDPEKSIPWIENTAIIAISLQLAAQAEGLGSCWVHMRGNNFNDRQSTQDYIAELVDLPSHLQVECVIAIGYADEEKTPYTQQELPHHIIHRHES